MKVAQQMYSAVRSSFQPTFRSNHLSEELLHSINNQLAVVMGNAELLGLKIENHKTQETCREIQAAASKINQLMYEYVGRNGVNRNTMGHTQTNSPS